MTDDDPLARFRVRVQALSQSLNLRSRLLRLQSASLVAGLQEQWFRESISAAVADLPDALGVLVGTADALDLLTVRPLGNDGSLERIRWSLQMSGSGASLHYADGVWDDLVVVAGPLHEAGFAYLDATGGWHDAWEPVPGTDEVLPSMVRLRARTATGTIEWLVPVAADRRSLQMLRPEDPGSGI